MQTATLTPEITATLETVLVYLQCEREHYYATPRSERRGHIYEAVISISQWLYAPQS